MSKRMWSTWELVRVVLIVNLCSAPFVGVGHAIAESWFS